LVDEENEFVLAQFVEYLVNEEPGQHKLFEYAVGDVDKVPLDELLVFDGVDEEVDLGLQRLSLKREVGFREVVEVDQQVDQSGQGVHIYFLDGLTLFARFLHVCRNAVLKSLVEFLALEVVHQLKRVLQGFALAFLGFEAETHPLLGLDVQSVGLETLLCKLQSVVELFEHEVAEGKVEEHLGPQFRRNVLLEAGNALQLGFNGSGLVFFFLLQVALVFKRIDKV